jgi:DNA modification methylase
VSAEDYCTFTTTLATELYRVAGKDCWMVFWFAFKWMGTVRTALLDAGWSIDEVPALWLKGNGRTPRPDILLARSYEPFFIARKGQPTVIKQGRMNAWMRNVDEKKYHPAQRPVGLMEDILGTFLDERRHNVLVPFAGSGATLRACYKMGHAVHGWDSNPEYKNHFMLAVEEDTKKLLAKE